MSREGVLRTWELVFQQQVLLFDANISSFSLAESPPRDLRMIAYK